MKHRIIILLSVFVILVGLAFIFKRPATSDILIAKDFETLSLYVKQHADQRTLVLFDVDGVLLEPTDAFNMEHPLRQAHKKDIRKHHKKPAIERIFVDFFNKWQVRLVHAKMPELIQHLKDEGIAASALTAWWTGAFGGIERMEEYRLRDLKSVGISFDGLSPFTQDMLLPPHPMTQPHHPMLFSGMILTDRSDKGASLERALEQIQHPFKKIIFIDDHTEYLEQVQQFCMGKNLDFVGIHYQESSKKPLPDLDPTREALRFKILQEEEYWLTDDELSDYLARKKHA